MASIDLRNITISRAGSAAGGGYSNLGGTSVPYVYFPNIVNAGNYQGIKLSVPVIYGASLEQVAQYTFRMGTSSHRVNFLVYATTPPSLSSGTSLGTNNLYGYIYVPDEAYDTYRSTSPWSGISSKIKKLSEWTGVLPPQLSEP